MNKLFIIINFSSICCLVYFLTGSVFSIGAASPSELNDEFIIEKVFLHHEEVDDLSVVCHIPLDTVSNKLNVLARSSLSVNKIECEALKDESYERNQEESAGWRTQNSSQTISEI